MAPPSTPTLSPLVSAKGLSTQRHLDAVCSAPKLFDAKQLHKSRVSTGVTLEYALHETPASTNAEQDTETAKPEPEAEHVILIMGFACHKEMWAATIDLLLAKWDASKRGLQVVSFDNRGMGGSDAPWGRYTTSQMAQDALALMDYLKWDSAHVVGYSMGGMISLELASAAPKRVNSLTLVVTTRGHFKDVPSSKDSRTGVMMAKDPVEVAKHTMNLLYSDVYLDQPMAESDKTRRQVLTQYHEEEAKIPAEPRFMGLLGQYLSTCTHWVNDERMAAINASGYPVLIVGAELDVLIPPCETRILREHLKGDHVHTLFFDQAGHGVTIQYPEEVVDGLLETFQRC